MSLMLTVSCGIMEMDEQAPVLPVDMHLERDSMYVMRGESFTVSPVFTPDSVTLTDMCWLSDNENIVSYRNNEFTAVREGWTVVRGMSISRQIEDSCQVCVLDWDADSIPVAPYETIVYADVKVGGKVFDPDVMTLGAFITDRLSGLGVMRTFKGVDYMELRVGSDWIDDSGEIIRVIDFILYDSTTHTTRTLSAAVPFDCETHGTLGNLFHLYFQ